MQTVTETLTRAAPQRTTYLAHALTPNQNAWIFALHFVTMYLELSIYIQDSLVFPYIGSTLLAVAGAVLNRSAIKPAHLSLLAAVIAIVAVAAFFAAIGGSIILLEFVRSFAQFIASIVSAYCIFVVGILSSRKRLIFWLTLLLGVIVIGAFLERYAPVKAFSDAVRTLIYPEALLYSADNRDVASYGAVRPRFLTREPSTVGIAAGLLIAMIFILAPVRDFYRIAGASIATGICIIVMRSPTIIFFAVIVLYATVALKPTAVARISWLFATIGAALLIGVSFLLVYGSGLTGLSNRAFLGGGSYALRIFGPPLIWLETIKNQPLFGLGIGSYDSLLPLARQTYQRYDILFLFPFLKDQQDGAELISNAFWEYWIFFGLVGGGLVVVIISRLFRSFGLNYIAFPFFASVLALQTFGGISAYRPWHMLFVFAALAFIVQRGHHDRRTAIR